MADNKSKIVEINENREEIMEIANAAVDVLQKKYGIEINHAGGIVTIASVFLEKVIDYLAKNKKPGTTNEINLLNLVTLGISHREGDGEKDGNFTPYAQPGQEFKLRTKSDEETESED